MRKYFQINEEIENTCENNKKFTNREVSYILSLPINKDNKDNKNSFILSNLIDNYIGYKYIKNEERVLLDSCKDNAGNKHYAIGTQTTLIKNDNIKNLVIQLKRFIYSKGVAIRLDNVVQLPKYLVFNDQGYELRGIGLHLGGSIDGGHYVYINNIKDKQYLYNDASFSEYTTDNLDISKNAYIINYERVDLTNEEYANTCYNQIKYKFRRLNDVDFVLDDIYNINNSVNNFKTIISVLDNKYYNYLSEQNKNEFDKIKQIITEKQERLKKFKILDKPFNFNSNTKEILVDELKNSLTNNGLIDIINKKDKFYYQPSNSSSNSNIFRGFWDGKKCFMKSFTLKYNENLEYEQKLYKYISDRSNNLGGEFSDNFVNVYRLFKINRTEFRKFYNTQTYEGINKNLNTNIFSNEDYIYFIVTEDISGVTVTDFYVQQCNNFKQKTNNNKYRDNIMEMLFELVYGLYLLNTRLRVIHNDNHFGNLLIKEQPEEKIYTINNTEYTRKRKYRVCIYDFDLSYFEGNTNPDNRLLLDNTTNQINSVVPLTDVNKGRDIYTIGNSLYGFSMYIKKTLNNTQFNNLINSNNTYNIFKILFETDEVIQNLVKNFEIDLVNKTLFWNSYCVTGNYPCVPVDFNNITAEKVLTRMLNSNDLKHILNITSIDVLFKKYLKYKMKYIKYINENKI